MQKIARFEKVSFQQFYEGLMNTIGYTDKEGSQYIYDNLKLPQRATSGSAGYDFFSPIDFTLPPGESIQLPTGVRVWMEEGWVLQIYPRSGLGFKYRLQLDNTVGIIDSDYYYSDNEGQVFLKITNDSRSGKSVTVATGEGVMQGIFIEYGITVNDNIEVSRNGGFGSTTNT